MLDADYIPVDFDAYSIVTEDKLAKSGPLPKEERIWRISSLTASVDDSTKILILPQPESKRVVKINDTVYRTNTYETLQSRVSEIESTLKVAKQEVKRYEDKTQDEINQDMVRKRKQQFGKLVDMRKYQLGGVTFCMFFYFFVYRRFLHPKSIANSVVYN